MIFLDVQGTLIDDLDRKPIRGAVALIERLNREGIAYLVITNNTKYPPEEFRAYLNGIGLAIPEERYLDALMNLSAHCPEKEIFAVGNDGFLRTLEAMGYVLTREAPKAVVVGIKEHLTYDDLADATEFLLGGARLVGMHETALYAKNGRRYPGLGAILRALEFASGRQAVIVGKPSESFYQLALTRLGSSSPASVTIVSDDPKGDLVGAKRLGMRTVFVLSGKYRTAEEIVPLMDAGERPDAVYPSVKEWMDEL